MSADSTSTTDSSDRFVAHDGRPMGVLPPAMLLLDEQRRILLASPAARSLLTGDGPLSLSGDVLSTRDPADSRRLAAAVAALRTDGGSIRTLTFGGADARLEVQLVTLYGEQRGIELVANIRSLAGEREQRLAQATRRFGLTPAEARLLGVLCHGSSLSEASQRLGVARTTVRTHLQRIFDKAGAHRQAELVGMVLAA